MSPLPARALAREAVEPAAASAKDCRRAASHSCRVCEAEEEQDQGPCSDDPGLPLRPRPPAPPHVTQALRGPRCGVANRQVPSFSPEQNLPTYQWRDRKAHV